VVTAGSEPQVHLGPRAPVQELLIVDDSTVRTRVRAEIGRGKDQCKIRDLLADVCCSETTLQFLSAADVERPVPGARQGRCPQFFFWFIHYSRATYLDHGEDM